MSARPARAHCLWRDLYTPFTRGTRLLSIWLREGFEQLGYTPPLPHVGQLVTDDWDESHAAQVNFGELWDATRRALAEGWTGESGAEAQPGTLLRITVKVPTSEAEASLPEVQTRL